MKKLLMFFFLLLILCYHTYSQGIDTLKFISYPPKDFSQALSRENKALLIDVREFFEYRKSRIRNAINIPSSGNLEFASDTLKKDYSLFLYCTSGFRSKRAAKYFNERGFPKVFSLDGGIAQWKKEGMPVDRKKIRK